MRAALRAGDLTVEEAALHAVGRRVVLARPTFGGNIIETGTESYRLAHTRAKRAAPQ
jgi:hypothetical protein